MRAALLSVAPNESDSAIHIERPKQASHGDFACNLAMQLARSMKRNPRQLAQLLVSELPYSSLVDKAEVAGAGFINFRLHRQPSSRSARHPRTGRGLWPLDDRRQAQGPGRVRLGQPDRTAARRPRSWRRLWRQPVQAARFRRLGRDQRILRQRRRPADGYPGLSTWLRYLELRGQAG
jgi:hypothetical protein